MSVERETLRDAALATLGVAIFVAFLIAGSLMDNGQTGTFLIVGGIVAFIVVMGLIGLLFLGDD